jgi:hypothetical protein
MATLSELADALLEAYDLGYAAGRNRGHIEGLAEARAIFDKHLEGK